MENIGHPNANPRDTRVTQWVYWNLIKRGKERDRERKGGREMKRERKITDILFFYIKLHELDL